MKASLLAALMVFSMAVRPAAANRVFSSGFELGSSNNNVEWSSGPVLAAITTSNVRTGQYAGWLRPTTRTHHQSFRITVPAAGEYFARCYFRFSTFPASETTVFQLSPGRITIDNGGTLRLYDGAGSMAGSTLSPGDYHRIELRVVTGNGAGFDESRMRVDGEDDAWLEGADYTSNVTEWEIGRNLQDEKVPGGEWRIDDCGLNDTLGTNNNGESSWPGAGSIVHLRANDEGDPDGPGVSQVGTKLGCTATTRAACLASLDEGQTYVGLDRADSYVDVAVENIALPADSQVQFVAIGVRFTCESDRPCNHLLGVKSASGGIVASALTEIALAVPYVWWTHSDDAGLRVHRLVQYRDPQDTLLRWTNLTLDTLQLRVATTDGNPDTNVSTAWVLVEYELQTDLAAAVGS